MYQMTDAAFAEAEAIAFSTMPSSIRAVPQRAPFSGRAAPRHGAYGGVPWTGTSQRFLVIAERRRSAVSKGRKLAAIIHLCGTGPATAFARRGFRLTPRERCGDHDVAAYISQINAMKRKSCVWPPRGRGLAHVPRAAETQGSGSGANGSQTCHCWRAYIIDTVSFPRWDCINARQRKREKRRRVAHGSKIPGGARGEAAQGALLPGAARSRV